jgi:UDP-N-acetylmuramate: L-alanyl-gamma-D-glutamyl-meso-diaminopimelate ligase
VLHKKLDPISIPQVKTAFGENVTVVNETKEVIEFIKRFDSKNKVLLMMSSGTFDGIDYEKLSEELI